MKRRKEKGKKKDKLRKEPCPAVGVIVFRTQTQIVNLESNELD